MLISKYSVDFYNWGQMVVLCKECHFLTQNLSLWFKHLNRNTVHLASLPFHVREHVPSFFSWNHQVFEDLFNFGNFSFGYVQHTMLPSAKVAYARWIETFRRRNTIQSLGEDRDTMRKIEMFSYCCCWLFKDIIISPICSIIYSNKVFWGKINLVCLTILKRKLALMYVA